MLIYFALPPEVNTARLMAGSGPAPMLQAAAGWEGLAAALEIQADELAASLSALASVWSGVAGERALAATMPMVAWLRTASAQAHKRAIQATAQADSYSLAVATTPPLPEIEQNHITHAALEATNFLGVNTVPIGLNEADYFVRMWNQAAGAMQAYQAETALNVTFEPILPMGPIVAPGTGEVVAAGALDRSVALLPGAAARETTFTRVSLQAAAESAGLREGRVITQSTQADADQPVWQGAQHGVQMMSQLGSVMGQVPQQGGQLLSQPVQQLSQPLQQVASLLGQMGGRGADGPGAQLGLIGASPFSNHPLAGGAGPASGAGLMRAAALPGAGGSPARTPLMDNLVGREFGTMVSPVAMGGTGVSAPSGPVPIGAGGGALGPMGINGQGAKNASSKPSLTAPAPLVHDLGEEDGDDW